jgi:hypothetical protein
VSFASEPGRDDGNLPPLNIVIPDDARELERDVLAYRREVRAQRRRQRLAWFVRPFSKSGGPAAIMPLIAACLALSLVGGALLSVVTMSPASAPTIGSQSSAQPTAPGSLTALPAGSVQYLNGLYVPVRSLVTSAIAIVPANCDCGPSLRRRAGQAIAAHVSLYFVGTGEVVPQLATLTAEDGDRAAVALSDPDGVLAAAYHPVGLTVLLVFHDATAEVRRSLSGDFQLGGTLSELKLAGRSVTASKAASGAAAG